MSKASEKFWEVDISRAILDSANAFGNLGKVGEEYLTNSLDAFETIVHDNPKLNLNRLDCKIRMVIDVSKKEIIFEDKHPLMGMSSDTIFNSFFKLHAENLARKRFVNVRGKYGTGKVASFGINADYFIVDSTHKGLRTTVKATKKAFFSGDKPKLDVINVNEKSNNTDNGTVVSISLANSKYVSERNVDNAIKHLQKIFGRFLDMYFIEVVTVMSNYNTKELRLSYNSPNAVYEKIYAVSDKYKKLIGENKLIIKRAAEPIEEEDLRGILITSNFYPKEQTYFGLDAKPYADRYFGEWEVSALDKYEGENPPMLSTRELRLNQDNEIVQAMYEFGREVLFKELEEFAENEKARKRDETTKKLDKIAQELNGLLNDDFSDYEEAKNTGKGEQGRVKRKGTLEDNDKTIINPGSPDVEIRRGDEKSFVKTLKGIIKGKIKIGDKRGKRKKGKANLEEDKNASKNASERHVERQKYGGGFTVRFEQLNHNDFIARVDKMTKVITVNLDADPMKVHLKNCSNNIYDSAFRMFAYSAAIDEYSRYCIHTQADNSEFFSTPPEVAQEAADLVRDIKKRIFDKLAEILKNPHSEENNG
jgi:hypothetical protein